MTSNMQLISFVVSFIFGLSFYFLTYLNFQLIKDLKKIIQHFLTFLYVLDMTFIYIIIFYKLNNGYFHIYFILMVIVGFLTGTLVKKYLISKINVKRKFKN